MTNAAFDFGELYREYAPVLTRQLGRSITNREDVADIVQETFVRAVRAADRYDPDLPAGPWLWTIARRISIDVLRSRASHAHGFAEIAGRHGLHVVDGPEDSCVNRAEARAALDAVAALPERQRRILLLRNVGCTYEEIADEEDLSVMAVKSLLNRARVAARRNYEIATGERRIPAWVFLGRLLRRRSVAARAGARFVGVGEWLPAVSAAAVLAVAGLAGALPAHSRSFGTPVSLTSSGNQRKSAPQTPILAPTSHLRPSAHRVSVAISPSGKHNTVPRTEVNVDTGHTNDRVWGDANGNVDEVEPSNDATIKADNCEATQTAHTFCLVLSQLPQPSK
jgi:RNA polymerase sigma-70 factor (ECF subfamily)